MVDGCAGLVAQAGKWGEKLRFVWWILFIDNVWWILNNESPCSVAARVYIYSWCRPCCTNSCCWPSSSCWAQHTPPPKRKRRKNIMENKKREEKLVKCPVCVTMDPALGVSCHDRHRLVHPQWQTPCSAQWRRWRWRSRRWLWRIGRWRWRSRKSF